MTTYPQIISQTLSIPHRKVESTIDLLAEGATIPFIARYRKEATGSLDEVQLAAIAKHACCLRVHTVELFDVFENEVADDDVHGRVGDWPGITHVVPHKSYVVTDDASRCRVQHAGGKVHGDK